MNKSLMFNIRISEEEKEELKELAAEAKLSLSDYIRQSVVLNSLIRETIEKVEESENDEAAKAIFSEVYDVLFDVIVNNSEEYKEVK